MPLARRLATSMLFAGLVLAAAACAHRGAAPARVASADPAAARGACVAPSELVVRNRSILVVDIVETTGPRPMLVAEVSPGTSTVSVKPKEGARYVARPQGGNPDISMLRGAVLIEPRCGDR